MRFLVLSDVHRRDKVVDWANRFIDDMSLDGAIVLGDITHFGPPQWAEEFLKALKGKVYALPGNCDPAGTLEYIERNATSLHLRKVKIGGHVVGGMGGSNPSIFETPNEMPEDEIRAALAPLMEPGMVLTLHCPAYGTLDVPFSGQHVGSIAIEALIREHRPRMVLSGHIHEDRGIVQKEGIVYMNPGPAKEGYAGILDLEGDPKVSLLDKVEE